MMDKKFRNRRDLGSQLGGIGYAVEALLSSKGRFRGQFDRMDKTLQRDFVKLLGFSNAMKIKYEGFMLKNMPHDLPEYLKGYWEAYDEISE